MCHCSVPIRFKSQRPDHRHSFHINKVESGAATPAENGGIREKNCSRHCKITGILFFYVVRLHFRIKIQIMVHVRAGFYCTK